MDFTFTEEQELFRKAVREFCQKKLAPKAREIENNQRIPEDIIKGMADLGLLGMTVSPEYGGAGVDPVMTGIAGEEIARADVTCATAVFFLVQASWGYILDRYGKKEVKEQILPKVAKGKAFLGIATTEPDAGSDLGNMRTVAKRVGEEYVLNGEKMYISGVREVVKHMEEGGGFLTLAKTAPERGYKRVEFLLRPIERHTRSQSDLR